MGEFCPRPQFQVPPIPSPDAMTPHFSLTKALDLKRLPGMVLAVGAIAIAGCSGSPSPPSASSPQGSPAATPTATSTATPTATAAATPADHSQSQQGGQVVEVGPYHLELVMIQEEGGAHVDLFLQTGDDHTPIPTATVTAQIQDPAGNERTLPLPYDAAGQHYAGTLPDTPSGNYQIRILAKVGDDAPTARFSVDF